MVKTVELFTDGSCSGNPGPGGFGVVLKYRGVTKELVGGYRFTTNNRMELLATVIGLESIKHSCRVILTTDSRYVCQGMTRWIHQWRRRQWLTTSSQPIKNIDLWQRLNQASAYHQVSWCWVKGHAGHPQNERCDTLARSATDSTELATDRFYENS